MELSKSDTTGVKGIAILFMLWHHLFLHSTEYGSLTQSLAIVFKVCVALFLFVSGYGLTKQYGSLVNRNIRTTIRFLLRRFINFFLPFWFCFILVVVIGNVCGYTFHDAYPATRNTLKCVILDFFGQMGYDSYLKPWWFNKMIIQLYLVFPILYMILSNRFTAIAGLIAIVLVQLYAKSIPGNVFFIVEGGLPAFYVGMLTSRLRVGQVAKERLQKIVFGIVAAMMGLCLSLLLLKVVRDPYVAVLIRAFLALSIVVVYKSFSRGDMRILNFVGKYSAFMYLTHVLLIVLLPKVVYFSHVSVLVFVFFSLACLLVAMVIDWLQKISRYDKLRMALLSIVNQ